MQVLQKRTTAVAAVIFTVMLAAPVRGEVDVVEAYAVNVGDDLTRDSLSDANLKQTKPAPSAKTTAVHRRRSRTDPKDFVATRSHRHHGEAVGGAHSRMTAKSKHRGPVVGFVYWWNGWVIRTFHTKFGTVLLGTVGAKS